MKNTLKKVLPPIVMEYFRAGPLSNSGFVKYADNWSDVESLTIGYDAQNIINKVLQSTLAVKTGEAVFERDSVLFDEKSYSWPLVASLMYACANLDKPQSRSIHCLDFGGSLGSTYFQNKAFLQRLGLIWSVVEQSDFVDKGNRHIANDVLHFYVDIQAARSRSPVDIVLCSSVLQYIANYQEVLQQLLALQAPFFVVDRLTLAKDNVYKVALQKVPKSIYKASYPCHIFSETDFLKLIHEAGYELIEDFVSSVDGETRKVKYKGYLFSLRT